MKENAELVFYVIFMVVIIVAVDFVFFRHQFQKRLIANIAIVAVFIIAYLLFLRRT